MPPESEHPSESVLVQLTRMEGKFDLAIAGLTRVQQDIAELKAADRDHVTDIARLNSTTQRLDEQATAEQAKAVALAAALKEAEATRRQKSEQSWTPFQRGLAVIVGLVTLATFLVYVLRTT